MSDHNFRTMSFSEPADRLQFTHNLCLQNLLSSIFIHTMNVLVTGNTGAVFCHQAFTTDPHQWGPDLPAMRSIKVDFCMSSALSPIMRPFFCVLQNVIFRPIFSIFFMLTLHGKHDVFSSHLQDCKCHCWLDESAHFPRYNTIRINRTHLLNFLLESSQPLKHTFHHLSTNLSEYGNPLWQVPELFLDQLSSVRDFLEIPPLSTNQHLPPGIIDHCAAQSAGKSRRSSVLHKHRKSLLWWSTRNVSWFSSFLFYSRPHHDLRRHATFSG